jgi:hypothetical protein
MLTQKATQPKSPDGGSAIFYQEVSAENPDTPTMSKGFSELQKSEILNQQDASIVSPYQSKIIEKPIIKTQMEIHDQAINGEITLDQAKKKLAERGMSSREVMDSVILITRQKQRNQL